MEPPLKNGVSKRLTTGVLPGACPSRARFLTKLRLDQSDAASEPTGKHHPILSTIHSSNGRTPTRKRQNLADQAL
jgi:hypothetical protein